MEDVVASSQASGKWLDSEGSDLSNRVILDRVVIKYWHHWEVLKRRCGDQLEEVGRCKGGEVSLELQLTAAPSCMSPLLPGHYDAICSPSPDSKP